MFKKTFFIPVLFMVFGVFLLVTSVNASHSWGSYHWARTANPSTLKLGDNVTTNWDAYLATAAVDWGFSNVLDTSVVLGSTNPKNCRAVAGRVEICNSKYGNNGWLGIASIWINGSHITQGTVKLNDTYFNTDKYNTPAWKNLVMCQEVGHTFGLDHQDEDFTNAPLGTCMDYSNDPIPNQHPDKHDYDMLETIYAHLDSSTTVSQTISSNKQELDHSLKLTWGKEIRKASDGHGALYEKDLGKGSKLFTFVIWAD